MNSEDSFNAFMRECRAHPLLTPEQELVFSRQVQRTRQLLELTTKGHCLTKQEKREVLAGQRAKQRMVNSNLRLVVTIARRYSGRAKKLALLDLVQEGAMGLIRAVDLYDATRGYKFSTYSYWWIRQGVTRALSQQDSPIRLPHGFSDKLNKLRNDGETLTQILGRTPTRKELAKHCEIKEKELALMMERSAPISSLDSQVIDGGSTLLDLVTDPQSVADDPDFLDDDYQRLQNAVELLDDRERFIIEARHALKTAKPLSQNEIAADLGLSRSRVSMLETRAMVKLRLFMANKKPPGYCPKAGGVAGLRASAQQQLTESAFY